VSLFLHLQSHAQTSPNLVRYLELMGPIPAAHIRRIEMNANPKITVVLSDDLLCHLRKVAQQQHIPLRWLVAGLLCDTFESGIDQTMNRQASCS
jgi:hypothetical protein